MGPIEFVLILVVACTALVHWRQGLLAGAALFVDVFVAGLLAFNFWEPLARLLGRVSLPLDPYADALCLTGLFVVALGILRLITRKLLPSVVYFVPAVQRVGGVFAGVASGYLIAGLALCILQTLPLPAKFLGYDATRGAGLGAPDRMWLAMVHRASGHVFDRIDEAWFDADGSFAERHARYRRADSDRALKRLNQGEFEPVLSTRKPAAERSD